MELENWQVNRMLEIVNAIKDFNRATDEKCAIDYDLVLRLDGADNFIAQFMGMEQKNCEDGNRLWWSDYSLVDNT
jgi:hypothetical protein